MPRVGACGAGGSVRDDGDAAGGAGAFACRRFWTCSRRRRRARRKAEARAATMVEVLALREQCESRGGEAGGRTAMRRCAVQCSAG